MNLISAVTNLLDLRGAPMDTAVRRVRGRMISDERKRELKLKRRLYIHEAAEFLEMATKTLQNKIYLSKKDPTISAPMGHKGRNGWEFDVPELEAWDRRN